MLFEEKEISLELCLFCQTTEMNCGTLKWSVWWNPLALCCHPTSQGITRLLSSVALPAAHTELLVLPCDNALQCQVKNAAALSMFSCPGSSTVCSYQGALGWRFASTAHGTSERKEHQNAENYFFDLLCYYLHTFRLCSYVCSYLQNPKHGYYNYTANLRSDKTITSDSVIIAWVFLKKAVV